MAKQILFREDAHDGTLEQFALSGQSFAALLLAKTATPDEIARAGDVSRGGRR